LGDALGLLSRSGPRWTVLAGGTDVYPTLTNESAWGAPAPRDVLDITAIEELARIDEHADAYRIGCLVTWNQLTRSELPGWFAALQLAALEVGGAQIQNRATVVGNVCNASPAADGIPPLLALGAELEITSRRGTRRLPVNEFVIGNRRTARVQDELVTAIWVPKHANATRSTFLKLGARRYLVISIVMVAAVIEPDAESRVARARVAVGSCSAAAQRLPELESFLVGASLGEPLDSRVEPSHLEMLSPIDDVRASAAYRGEAALVLVRRALRTFHGEAS
jgi:CO/xanthine dehydrogenase FAD-binding subunit